jgi:hypothetical protein
MRRRLAYILVPLALIGISGAIISGCGQAIGEKCQIDSDCSSGLCNSGTGLCQSPNSNTVDTNLLPDTKVPVPDATVDAKVDAMPIDASPPDA